MTGSVVVLALGGSRYGVPMSAVDEVGRVTVLTRLPGVPAWLAGVTNWRGRILGVLDLGGQLAEPATAADPGDRRARLVVLCDAGRSVGLLADAVEGVRDLPAPAEPVPATARRSAAALLAGQVTFPDGPLGLLDVAAVLALRQALQQR